MRKGGAHGWEWSWPIALLLPLLFALNTRAQSMEQWIAWGDAAMARGEHYGASRFYAGALEREPGRMALQWKMAEACRLSNQYDKAADLYDRVYRKDQGRTYPECLRWLGEMQLCDAQYTEAERTWRRVQQRSKDPVLKERARNALTGIELARTPAADTLVVEHLPAPLNTGRGSGRTVCCTSAACAAS
jgi:tetratricopeptide (TPR) repeat protein